jgi:hypothetical protein
MKNRERNTVAAILAILAPGWAQVANAEEIFRQTQGVSCLPNGAGCAQFQGYIYVHREADAEPSPMTSSGDAQLDEGRLYLHLGSAESR